MTIKAHSWDSIEAHYMNAHGLQREKFLELINYIKTTGLSNRLFAFTSLYTLVVGIYETMELQREALHITFDSKLKIWSFKYYSVPFTKPEFSRKYPEDIGIEKFSNFLKMIRW